MNLDDIKSDEAGTKWNNERLGDLRGIEGEISTLRTQLRRCSCSLSSS